MTGFLLRSDERRNAVDARRKHLGPWESILSLAVILRLKQYHLFAPQTVPLPPILTGVSKLVLFALLVFGRRPGLRFGTV